MAGRGRLSSWSLMGATLAQITQLLCYFSTMVAVFWRFVVALLYANFFQKSYFFNLASARIWLSVLSPQLKQNLLFLVICLIFLQKPSFVNGMTGGKMEYAEVKPEWSREPNPKPLIIDIQVLMPVPFPTPMPTRLPFGILAPPPIPYPLLSPVPIPGPAPVNMPLPIPIAMPGSFVPD